MVDVGQGLTEQDYEGQDVVGKAVLVSGAGWGYRAATKMAAVHGAVGVITDNIVEVPPARTRENAPEQIAYGRVWVEDDGSSVFCLWRNSAASGSITGRCSTSKSSWQRVRNRFKSTPLSRPP